MTERTYVAGDVVRVELGLQHRANLSTVAVIFEGEGTDAELHLEGERFEQLRNLGGGLKNTVIPASTTIPTELPPGTYALDRVYVRTVGGQEFVLRGEERLGAVSTMRIEVQPEPTEEPPLVEGMDLL